MNTRLRQGCEALTRDVGCVSKKLKVSPAGLLNPMACLSSNRTTFERQLLPTCPRPQRPFTRRLVPTELHLARTTGLRS
jgi:hypothetical protein